MRSLELTSAEQAIVLEALETYMEGFEEATNQTILDRGLDTPEQLLVAIDGIHQDYANASSALAKLRVAVHTGG